MTTRHLLDPELHALVDAFPGDPLNDEALPEARAVRLRRAVLHDVKGRGIDRSEVHIPRTGGTQLRALLYRPTDVASPVGGYLHIHGGGYILGTPEATDARNIRTCAGLGLVVLSVDYRLAPEHPVPAALEDCYLGLAWLHDNAGELKIERDRIAVGGESAGGGLAAAVAIKARDEGRYALCHQHLTYPMLDDRTGSEQSPGDPLTGEYIWTRAYNRYGWRSYLGGAEPCAPHVPARVEDVSGLPHTWLFTGALDLFRDENIHYAQRLLEAGVSTDLVVYAGACHGFGFLEGTRMVQRFDRDHLEALGRAFDVRPS